MTYFMRSGTTFRVTTGESLDLHDTLPVGTYAVQYEPLSGSFYLDRIRDLEVSGKVYGDALNLTGRILATFQSRSESTGVLLSGEKGSGKTLQAKLLSREAGRLGIPTVVVNQPFRGDQFNNFIQMIDQPIVVIFDEFEKVYDREQQEAMLTLLDGIYPSKKLFVLTCNDRYRINEAMRNRPGRLFYRIDYKGIEEEFVREYAADNLEDASEEKIDGIVMIAAVFASFNFDMLQALVEEMNRYSEDAKSAVRYLNARPDEDDLDLVYDTEMYVDGELLDEFHNLSKQWSGNPVMGENYLVFRYLPTGAPLDENNKPKDRLDMRVMNFDASDLVDVTVDKDGPRFKFENDHGSVVYLTRHKQAPVYSMVF